MISAVQKEAAGPMRPPKKEKGNRSIYRFFLWSYVTILLLAMSSCLVYALKIHAQINRENTLSRQVLLSSLRSDIETNLSYVQEQCDNLAFNTDLLLYIQHPELYSPSEVMRALSTGGALKDYVLDYFLYLTGSDEVITPAIRMKSGRFFDIMYQLESLNVDELRRSYLTPYHFHEYLGPISIRPYNSSHTLNVLPYIQSLPISSFGDPPAQLVLLLDIDKMFARAQALHVGTDLPVYILDNSGRLIYASPDAPELDPAQLDGAGQVVQLPGAVATRLVSDTTGWQYLVATPYRVYYQQNLSTLLFLGGVFLVYLAGGLLLVRRLAKRSYRPVKDINDLILQSGPSGYAGQNEYEAIKHALLGQMKSHREMLSLLEARQPVMLRDCLARLVHGQVRDYEAARQRLAKLGAQPPSDLFLCALAEIDTDSPFFLDSDTSPEESLSLARLIVQNVGCELLEAHFSCQHLDLTDNQSLFILCLPQGAGPDGAAQNAAEALAALARFTVQHFALDLLLGVGQVQQGLPGLPLCFDEARKALEHSRYQAGGEPVLFAQAAGAASDYYFPPESEQQLLELLRSGSSNEAHALLARIFSANFEAKKIGTMAARGLLYQLATTLQRAMNMNALAQGENAVLGAELVERVLASSSIDHARQRLDALIDQICQARQGRPVSRTEKLVEGIAEYIDAHTEGEWLDLNNLSQQFGVTPQYISNVFKKYRDENIKDYIAKRKLAHAKELLATTELTVKEVAARLGYANEIGVIRLFRKYEGVTPGDYRLQHGPGAQG